MDRDAWMTTGEVARLCRVDRKTVIRWCDLGVLVCERIAGGHRWIARKEWERFKKEHHILDD